MNMKIIFFILIISAKSILTEDDYGDQYVNFEDCGSDITVEKLRIEGCDGSPQCNLTIGSDAAITFDLNFHSGIPINNLTNKVSFVWRGTEWDLTSTPNPCNVMECPIRTVGFRTNYNASLYINAAFVQLKGNVRWMMFDTLTNDQSLCIDINNILLLYPQ